MGGNHHQLESRSLQGPDGVSAQSIQPGPRSIPLDGNYRQLGRDLNLNISSSIVLPPQKQVRTTLIVRVAPSLDYLPLKLSECMTPQTFYNKALGVWEIPREKVAKMTVTFTWMDPKDTMRTMVMNSQVEGCFPHLIEQVDDAPSWAEAPEGRGKCILDVNILLRD